MEITLAILSGVFWSLTYILIIVRGFKDKTFGMPLVALCANISWEFIFSFIYPSPPPQVYINITWFLLDAVIVFQIFYFGKSVFADLLPKGSFIPLFLLSLILSFVLILNISAELDNYHAKYAAFGQNFIMSVLFVFMLLRRNDLKGQSIYIALFKMIGTVLPSILFYTNYPALALLNTLYIAIFIFDALYLVMLYAKHKELGINPWKRI